MARPPKNDSSPRNDQFRIDELDLAILRELRKDAWTPISHIAKIVGYSTATCGNRIKKLKDNNYIEQPKISVPEAKTKFKSFHYIMIKLSNNNHEHEKEIYELSKTKNNIIYCDGISGDYDFILYVGCYSDSDLTDIRDIISKLDNVKNTYTFTRMSVIKDYEIGIDDLL